MEILCQPIQEKLELGSRCQGAQSKTVAVAVYFHGEQYYTGFPLSQNSLPYLEEFLIYKWVLSTSLKGIREFS